MYISIIVPCYNAAKYLPDLITSVQKQTISDWELLLIDDGSKDNTHEVVKKYLGDKRIHYIFQDNAGVSKARNRGLDKATGEYVTCVDADDWLEPDFIEVFQKSNLADINICGYREIYPDGDVRTEWIPETQYSSVPLDTYTVRNSYFRTPWAVVFRHDFLKINKLHFLEDLSWGEDTVFLLLATMRAKDIRFISDILYDYRYTGKGLTNSPYRHHNMVQFLDTYTSYIKIIYIKSVRAALMMNELVLFLSIILLNEVVVSDKSKQAKMDIIHSIHKYLRHLPFFYILRTKVGRIRYVAAVFSRILPSSISLSVYKRIV